MHNLENIIEENAFKILKIAETILPEDVVEALKKARDRETKPMAKAQFEAILRNIEIAKTRGLPICQDTGTIIWFVEVGEDFPIRAKLRDILVNATRRATKEIPLRPNAVNPWLDKNSGDNTGRYFPFINWEIVPGDELKLTVMPKGGGSENTVALWMLTPSQGIRGFKKAVIDTIYNAGPKPCPPVIVGAAIAGGSDIAIKLAKKAVLRPVGQRNEDEKIAKLEEELLEALNSLGIGPMGLGGKTTVLDVHIDWGHRHPASFPVAVVTQCWAARSASIKITKDGDVELLSRHSVKLGEV
ncbi:MAG: fumarate hydratase [Candidatus Njordarchaeia archaeon]